MLCPACACLRPRTKAWWTPSQLSSRKPNIHQFNCCRSCDASGFFSTPEWRGQVRATVLRLLQLYREQNCQAHFEQFLSKWAGLPYRVRKDLSYEGTIYCHHRGERCDPGDKVYLQALQLCAPRWLRESGFGLDRAADMLEGMFGEAARLGQPDNGVCKFFNLLLQCLMLLWYATGRDPLSYMALRRTCDLQFCDLLVTEFSAGACCGAGMLPYRWRG